MFIKGASGDDYINQTKEAMLRKLAFSPDKSPNYINQSDGIRGNEENLASQQEIKRMLPPKRRIDPLNPDTQISPNIEPVHDTSERTTFQPTFKDENEALKPAPGDEGKSLGGDPPTIEQQMHGKSQPLPVNSNSPIMQQINNSAVDNNHGSPLPLKIPVTNNQKRKTAPPNAWDTMRVKKNKGRK